MHSKLLFVLIFYLLGICGLNAQMLNKPQGTAHGKTAQKLRSTTDSPFGMHPASIFKSGYTNNGYIDAQNIGIKWTRQELYAFWFLVQPDLSKLEYDFSLYDRQWSAIPTDINILANIAPEGPINKGRFLPHSYMPIDNKQYKAFVRATVERYDGDGINDMPGLLNPIKFWQVGNEPNTARVDFADLQKITYTAIKEVCPNCQVLVGGVPGMPPVNQYIKNFAQQYKAILDSLGGKYIDIMDFHWYGDAIGDYLGLKDVYNHIRTVMNADGFASDLPFWITEMGAYSGDPVQIEQLKTDWAPQTENQQALDYFKRFVYSLSLNIKKIFTAFGFMEGFKFDDGYFDHTGLIYDGWGSGDSGLGVKKLSYYTYKKMTEVLEGSDWNDIQTIKDSANVFICKFMKNGKPIYAAWWDYFRDTTYTSGKTKQITLTALQANSVLVTEVVPKFFSGAEVTDYSIAFCRDTLSVLNDIATLTLGEKPVFVEMLTNTSVDDGPGFIPQNFVLYQNYPNPFNPATKISFSLPKEGFTKLTVYDLLGNQVTTLVKEKLSAGTHSVNFDATNLPSGVYLYALSSENYSSTKKMLLIK